MNETHQLCTFYLDQQMFGVDALTVQEVSRYQEMTRVPLTPASFSGLINLRGQIVSAIDLRERLGMPPRPAGVLPMNVVIRGDEGPISLLVDQIGDVIEVDNSQFETPPETLLPPFRQLVDGTYKLEHTLLLLLNCMTAVQTVDEPA
ncbi:MAG TPA: chemotaxis protein CheW [Pirellulaceae bacterium]|nr:chemotaxis protein CheW [Pirellulaceae bacterium]HMO94429.1 chemotaxis protein CheW [Pirellulaceae bacterium]HMP71574.1 chemotaxis protein CheW [Pirellulaceae bacterium]